MKDRVLLYALGVLAVILFALFWVSTAGSAVRVGPGAEALLAEINAVRMDYGMQPLKLDRTLRRAAGMKARRIWRTNRFSHDGPNPTTAGWQGSWGENLAWSNLRSFELIVDWWVTSPAHAKTLFGNYTKVGVWVSRPRDLFGVKDVTVFVMEAGR